MKKPIGPLRVESLVNGGTGIVRADGRVIFVPQVVPGDEIIIRVRKEKKRYAEAELIEIVKPSAQRRVMPCPVAADCGGCQWQQLPYADQLRWKQQLFHDTLIRQCSVDAGLLLPIVAAPDEWHYRSRVQIKCQLTSAGFICGFFKPKSHFVVAMERCPVIAEPLNDLLGQLRPLLGQSVFAGQIDQIDLSVGDCQRRRAVVHYQGADVVGLTELLLQIKADEKLELLIQSGRSGRFIPVSGAGDLTINVDEPPLSLSYAAGGFAQINLAQNRQLLKAVIAAANLTGSQRVLDLYCGMGNFSLPLARRARQVCGVEDYSASIEMARRNAVQNQLENLLFYAQPAEGMLSLLAREEKFDLLLLDPPRAGAFTLMDELLAMPVPRVIYVSCDAQTLARDLKVIINGGYRLVSSEPFDMFPQTHHVESISVLEYCR
ncbi:MAG TPA: class I SAM-dependent RNA methyltransferase [Malonomonas sp.]